LLSEGYAPEASEREEREEREPRIDNVRYCFHVLISFHRSSPRLAGQALGKSFRIGKIVSTFWAENQDRE
jgi:hypothetical protein